MRSGHIKSKPFPQVSSVGSISRKAPWSGRRYYSLLRHIQPTFLQLLQKFSSKADGAKLAFLGAFSSLKDVDESYTLPSFPKSTYADVQILKNTLIWWGNIVLLYGGHWILLKNTPFSRKWSNLAYLLWLDIWKLPREISLYLII